MSLEVSPLLAYDTAAYHRGRQDAARAGRPAQPAHQDPRHEGGPAGDHRMRRLRRTGERHAAVLRRPLPRRRGRVPGRRSNAGSARASIPRSARSRRSSCHAGTSRSPDHVPAELKDRLGLAVGLDVYRAYRRLHGLRPACSAWRTPAHARSGCCGRARGPRTPKPPTRSTCTGSPRRSPSTRCPTRRSRRSTTTARWASRCPPTAATATLMLRRFTDAGVDVGALAGRLQGEGAESFVTAWNDLVGRISAQRRLAHLTARPDKESTMATDRPMQLGMVGLGRMGANLVRRLMRDGHRCVVYDVNAHAVRELAGEGARPGRPRWRTSWRSSDRPRAIWLMLPAAVVQPTLDQLVALLDPDDIVIDGGNSYYRDDITRAKQLADRQLHYVDCGTSRRRLGPRPGLLPDDRRRGRAVVRAWTRYSAPSRPARVAPNPRRAGRGTGPRPRATCTAVRTAPATS